MDITYWGELKKSPQILKKVFFLSCHIMLLEDSMSVTTPKCDYSTCTNIPARVSLILPPKLWQRYGHIGTQVESFLPTIRAPHLRLSEQQSHKPQKNLLSFAMLLLLLLLFFFFFFAFRQRRARGSFLFQGLPFAYVRQNV